jgi:hypothetical protein
MMIVFNKTYIDKIWTMYEEYTKGLSGVSDDYWEDQILKGTVYTITVEGNQCGCFSILESNEEGNVLSSFYLRPEQYRVSQMVFAQLLKEFGIKKIMVATCDELMLSLSMDVQKRVEPHAYFFDGTIQYQVRAAEYSQDWLSPLQTEDLETYKTLTDSFFGEVTKELLDTSTNYYFKLQDPSMDSQPLGYGYIGVLKIRKGFGACGMITVDSQRKQGVGRSIQLHLAEFCRKKGLVPISGCWYYNHLSKKTIESAGRYTKTRYLDIFTE